MADDDSALVVSPWASVELSGQPAAARREARQRVLTLLLSLARTCRGASKMPLLPVEMWADIMARVAAVHMIPLLAFHANTNLPRDLKGVVPPWITAGDYVAQCPAWYHPVGSCTSVELRPSQHLGSTPVQTPLSDADSVPASPSASTCNDNAHQNTPPMELKRAGGVLVWRPSTRKIAECFRPRVVDISRGSVSHTLVFISKQYTICCTNAHCEKQVEIRKRMTPAHTRIHAHTHTHTHTYTYAYTYTITTTTTTTIPHHHKRSNNRLISPLALLAVSIIDHIH